MEIFKVKISGERPGLSASLLSEARARLPDAPAPQRGHDASTDLFDDPEASLQTRWTTMWGWHSELHGNVNANVSLDAGHLGRGKNKLLKNHVILNIQSPDGSLTYYIRPQGQNRYGPFKEEAMQHVTDARETSQIKEILAHYANEHALPVPESVPRLAGDERMAAIRSYEKNLIMAKAHQRQLLNWLNGALGS